MILAGLHYDTPWTRDAAINAWNGGSLMVPECREYALFGFDPTGTESKSAVNIGTP